MLRFFQVAYIYDIHSFPEDGDNLIDDALGSLPVRIITNLYCLDFSELRTSMTYIVSTEMVITDHYAVLLKHPSHIDKRK